MTLFLLKPARLRRPRSTFFPNAFLGAFLGTVFCAALPTPAQASVSGRPVVLGAHPGSGLDSVARTLSADQLQSAAKHHDQPLILIASVPLSPGRKNIALFVQLQSGRLCGSAGCATSVYLRHGTKWDTVLDSVNGEIAILRTRHKGLYDLLVDGDDKWIWNGKTYQDTLAAQ